ncbi:MAG TPA: hypothetical protein ENG87_00150 [Candidatus Pacearchaeota archaeon]|nr:hypothetical protein [Candidatus Pacearchaeota archaeon]
MKKVLIIAYYYPPRGTIGAQRPHKLAKYFPRYGWEPTVLTVRQKGYPPEDIKTIETEYIDIARKFKSKLGFNPDGTLHDQLKIEVSKNYDYTTWKSKLIKLSKEIIAYPDYQKGWYKYAIKAASEILFKEKIDAIISTSYPVTAHLIARQLKKRYKVPWVADLRDLWTQNHFYNKYDLIKYFERRLELKTLSDANVLVTVTNRFANDLKKLHRDKRVICITNGYDAEEYPEMQTKLTDKFTITHTGQLYGGKRDPSMLFFVISDLIKGRKIEKDMMEIRFYGPEEKWLNYNAKEYNLSGIVKQYGIISREEVKKKQKESQLLLLLLDKNNKENGVYPAKVFEYFGARRPIVAIGGKDGIIKELLEKTNSGKFAGNHEILQKVIYEYYREFINSGEIKCRSNGSVENFSYQSIAKKYSDVLNRLL